MDRQEGHKHTHIPFHSGEFQHASRYQEDRSPQWNISNESSPSIAQRRVAPNGLNVAEGHALDDDDDLVFISYSDTLSGPPSEGTASAGTVVNRKPMTTAPPPVLPESALTSDNIDILNLVQPLGTKTIYEWVHGRRCPGDFDVKDLSSRESIKVRCPSRVSQSTTTLDDEYCLVNHPSASVVACAGGWAEDAALPAGYGKLELD